MSEKFDYYDAVAHLIPGAVGCLLAFYHCDLFGITIPVPKTGQIAELGIGVAIAYTAGHLLQSVASFLEPVYYFMWGGQPSVVILEKDTPHLTGGRREQYLREFQEAFGVQGPIPSDRKKKNTFYQGIFQRCMGVCNKNKLGRVERFVTIYGFHRVMLTTFFLSWLVLMIQVGRSLLGMVALLPEQVNSLLFLVPLLTGATVVEVFRSRARGYHYAREVVSMTAEFLRTEKNKDSKKSVGFE